MENAITIKNLSKRFYNKNTDSLSDISVDIHDSQIVGIFGYKGSGKSTLLKILGGITPSYSGDVYIYNNPIGEVTKKMCSYLGEEYSFEEGYNVKSIVSIYKAFYKDLNPIIIDSLMAKFGIDLNSKFEDLNSRNQKILALSLAISRNTKIYLLDEPLCDEGLDKITRDFIFDTIFSTCPKDSLIIITSSEFSDIEDSCNSVIFLDKGKIIKIASREQLINEYDMSLSLIFKEVVSND